MNRKETFVVHIVSQENASWQGRVTWLEQGETLTFRSFMELVKMIDNVIMKDDKAAG